MEKLDLTKPTAELQSWERELSEQVVAAKYSEHHEEDEVTGRVKDWKYRVG